MLTVGVGFNNSQIARQVSMASAQIQRGLSKQPLGRITGQANEFQKSLEASNARVVAFGASAGAIYAIRAAFSKLVSSTIEVEQSLTEINNLLNIGQGDMSKFSSGLFKVANDTGTSFANAAKVAQEFARQGLGVEQTLKRTNSALILTRLSSLPLEDAVSSLTATMNAFAKEALTDTEIVNRFANVDARFAVSAGDLAEAFKRVGSSAADAGVDFNQTIALVTAAQQATARGGSVIGNSFKTIFTRLQRPQVLDDLENAGVKVRDLTGKALPLIQVLKNLSASYDTLSSGQKSFVAETVGGVYQINVLKSILNDLGSGLSIYKGAFDAANDSTAAADVRIQALNKTISSQLVRTVNDLTQASASIGKIVFEPSIRGGLGAFDSIIKKIGGALSENNEGIGATLFKGIGAGLGNVLSGPGIQFAVFGLIKLFQRLQNFIIDSVKDLTGVNEKAKERAAIEHTVIEYMTKQKDLLANLRSGQETIGSVHDQILAKIQKENFLMSETAVYAKAVADALSRNVSIGKNPLSTSTKGKTSASGFVPNLAGIASQEAMGARMGGYSAGAIVSTSVSDGRINVPVVANMAETKAAVVVGNKRYEWINPPKNSAAGARHARESKTRTGIDPYSLDQYGLAADGFVPNLAMKTLWRGVGGKRVGEKRQFLQEDEQRDINESEIRSIIFDPKPMGEREVNHWVSSVKSNFGMNKGGIDLNELSTYIEKHQTAKFDRSGFLSTSLKESIARSFTSGIAKDKFGLNDSHVLGKMEFPEARILTPDKITKLVKRFGAKRIGKILYNRSMEAEEKRGKFIGFDVDKFTEYSQNQKDPFYNDINDYFGVEHEIALLNKGFVPNLTTKSDLKQRHPQSFFDPNDLSGLTLDNLNALMAKAGRARKFYASQGDNQGAGDALDTFSSYYNEINKRLEYINSPVNIGDPNKAHGFVPNLAVSEDDIDESKVISAEELVAAVKTRLARSNPGDAELFEKAFFDPKKNRKPFYTVSALRTTIEGVLGSPIFEGRYKDNKANKIREETKTMTTHIRGFLGGKTPQETAKTEDFDLGDIKSILALRSKEFAVLSAFNDFGSKSVVQEAGEGSGITDIHGEKIKVGYRYTGLKDPMSMYRNWKEGAQPASNVFAAKAFGLSGDIDMSNESTKFGIDFDDAFKAFARSKGVRTSRRDNDNLDILGYSSDIMEKFQPIKEFAAADTKTSLTGDTPASMAGKIARAIAFKKGTGKAIIPVFNDVKKFTGKGNIGMLDFDHFNDGRKDFDSLVYHILGLNKGLRVNLGASGSGKTIDALAMGAKPVQSRDESHDFSEFILNTSARTNLDSGLLGLALASASSVVGFDKSKEEILANLKKRIASPNEGDTRTARTLQGDYDNFASYADTLDYSDVFKQLTEKFKKTGRFTKASHGLIPNLATMYESVADALERENAATGGNGMLSRSRDLVSSTNPLGLAAVDKKSQGDADAAIQQHKMLGQSMNEIKTASTSSRGHIPNLAIDNSNTILLSGVLGLVQNLKGFDGLKDTLGSFKNALGSVFTFMDSAARKEALWIASTEKATQAQKEWIKSAEAMGQSLKLEPGKKKTFEGADFTNIDDFEKSVGPRVERAQQDVKDFSERKAAQNNRIQKVGFAASIGGGVVGGIASQFIGKASPDAAAASEEFFSGVQTAGQVLTVFQGGLAKAAGLFFVLNGAVNAASTFASGLEGAKRGLEIQQSQTQKLVAGLDGVSAALSNMNNMILDSSVTLEALGREQKKYQDSLAIISSTGPEGSAIAASIQSSPDNSTKIQLINYAKELESKKLNQSAGLFQLKELGAERSLPLLGAGLSGGLFGAGNEVDKAKSASVLQSNAGNIFSNLDGVLKDALIKNVGDSSKFQSVISNDETYQSVSKAIKENGGTDSDISLLVAQLRLLVGNDAANKDPNVTAVRQKALERSAKAQLNVDFATKNETAYRRTFLNAGVVQSQNVLDIAKIGPEGYKTKYNKSIIQDSAERAKTAAIGFQYNEETVGAFEYKNDVKKTEVERQFKINNLKDQTSRSLLDAYSQNVDVLGKSSDTGKTSEITGQSTPRVGESKENILTALNKGLTEVTKGGNLNRFIGPEGGFDFKSFEKEVVDKGGGSTETNSSLQNYLASNRGSLDILKIIQSNNNELVDINQESLKELQIHTAKFDALKAELALKDQTKYLGGTKALTDRNYRREVTRNFIRGGRLMETGKSLETRARGAAQFLAAAKENGLDPLKIAKRDGNKFVGIAGDATSQKIAKALNLVTAGVSGVQQNMMRRVNQSFTRNGPNSDAAAIFNSINNDPLAKDAAAVAVSNTFKPKGDEIKSSAENLARVTTENINKSLDEASTQVLGFANVLAMVKKNLEEAVTNKDKAQKVQLNTTKLGAKEVSAAQKLAQDKLGDAPKDQKSVTDSIPKSSNIKSAVGGTAALFLTGALIALSKGRRVNIAEKFKDAKGFIGEKGKTAWDFANKPIFGTGKPKPAPYAPKSPYGYVDKGQLTPMEAEMRNQRAKELRAQRKTRSIPEKKIPFDPTAFKGFNVPEAPVPNTISPAQSYGTIQAKGLPSQALMKLPYSPAPIAFPTNPVSIAEGAKIRPKSAIARTIVPSEAQFNKNLIDSYGKAGPIPNQVMDDRRQSSWYFKSIRQGMKPNQPVQMETPPIIPTVTPQQKYSAAVTAEQEKKGSIGKGLMDAVSGNKNRGFTTLKTLGGIVGGTATSLVGYGLGSAVGNSVIGDSYGIGSMVGGAIGSSALTAGAAKAAPYAARALPALGGLAMANPLAATALVVGGAVAGRSIYKTRKETEGISTGSAETVDKTKALAIKQYQKGKAPEAIMKDVDIQINNIQKQISESQKGFVGWLSGADKQDEALQGQIAALEELKAAIIADAEARRQQASDSQNSQNLTSLLEKIANGSGGGKSNITVEISLKDADKLPDIFNSKIIKPLEEQLKILQGRASNIEGKVGIGPQPSAVG